MAVNCNGYRDQFAKIEQNTLQFKKLAVDCTAANLQLQQKAQQRRVALVTECNEDACPSGPGWHCP